MDKVQKPINSDGFYVSTYKKENKLIQERRF
jgi:hypothetical protein